MPHQHLTSDQVLVLLAEHPSRIAELTRGLTPDQLRAPPGRDEWSANDVLAHLRACADVWGGYMRTILDDENPRIRAVSPRSVIDRTDYRELDFARSLRAFDRQRADLLSLLHRLAPGDWSRTARVTRSGKVFDETVLSYAARLAEHERHHLEQFARIAGRVERPRTAK